MRMTRMGTSDSDNADNNNNNNDKMTRATRTRDEDTAIKKRTRMMRDDEEE